MLPVIELFARTTGDGIRIFFSYRVWDSFSLCNLRDGHNFQPNSHRRYIDAEQSAVDCLSKVSSHSPTSSQETMLIVHNSDMTDLDPVCWYV